MHSKCERSYHLKEELPPVAAIKCESADEAIKRQPQMAEATGLEPATFGVTGQPFYRKVNVLQLSKSGFKGRKLQHRSRTVALPSSGPSPYERTRPKAQSTAGIGRLPKN